ncbi:MAG: hypothetical protein ABIH41_01370 [Nanoarchaeota archaeon]
MSEVNMANLKSFLEHIVKDRSDDPKTVRMQMRILAQCVLALAKEVESLREGRR